MEKLNLTPAEENTSDIAETNNLTPAEETTSDVAKADESVEKPDFVKKIESFDINNLSPENIEFMEHVIQDVFRENFPVDSEIIDRITERIRIVENEEFVRLLEEDGGDTDIDSGFYNSKPDQIVVNISMHHSPGALFSTMFHESLHFVSINSGAGFNGGFCYPGVGENEADEFIGELDEGVRVMREGTTHAITRAYVMDYLKFDPQPEMFGYEPECLVTDAIWGAFSSDEKMQAYFKTPMELLRVRIESAFEEDYDVDRTNGVFANCLVNVARATKQMRNALKSWGENGDREPIEAILKDICHAVGLFIVREVENGERVLDEEDEESLRDYLEPYLVKE